jgi:thiamine biosynthesis lipoprotein
MGTDVCITVLHVSRDMAEDAIDEAMVELAGVEEVMSLYRPDSQVSVLNRQGAIQRPDARLVDVLLKAEDMSRRSEGAFDVTVQPLWELWAAAKKQGRRPTPDQIAAAAAKVDWRKVELSTERIALKTPGMAITLNGIAQGYAADRVLDVLRTCGVEHALVNTGEIGALGDKGGGEPWTVGIQHPRRADAFIGAAKLTGGCLATSGDYQTAFSDDRKDNHLFDPATGRSREEFSSVSVFAPKGVDADALSTAVSVVGYERGLRLLEGTSGAEAMFVMKDGRVAMTARFPRA